MKSLISAVALAVAGLCASAPASAAIVVSFSPASTSIAIGDSVSVQMNISGLDAEILSAFDINLLFDNTIVSNFSVTHNVASQWPGGGVFGPSVFGAGNTGVIDYALADDAALAASQANDFTVLTFGFTGLADGFTILSLGLNPDFQQNFVGLNFATLAAEIGTACIAVGTGSCDGGGGNVPEPATYGLLGLGLLAAGAASRTRRRERETA